MQGRVVAWFQALRDSERLSTWFDFLQAIKTRFSAPAMEADLEILL